MRIVLTLLVSAIVSLLPNCRKCGGPEGNWEGKLKTPGGELSVVFHVTRDSSGKLAATVDSPDQDAMGIAFDTVSFAGGRLRLKVNQLGGVFEGTMSSDDRSLNGSWKQGPISLPLVMRRTDKAAVEFKRPQEPKPPYPYKEEEVTVANPAANLRLAGTLTLPDSDGPFPAVVLITGSGPENRNEEVFCHKPFLVLADYLTRRGIAVLRCDDRGTGKSTGDYSKATTADFATDAEAQVQWLKTRKEIDPKRIGLLGHSEGGIIAPLAASHTADIAFVVLMAGTGLRGDSVLMLQVRLIARSQGLPDSVIAAALRTERQVLDIARSDKDSTAAAAELLGLLKQALTTLSEPEKDALQMTEAGIEQEVRTALSPWFRFFVRYDPAPALRRLRIPVLAVNGGLDVQVAPRENLAAIEAALRAGGNKDFEVVELPGLNHLLQTARTGAITEYSKTEETIAPAALATIGDWILAHAGQR
jgi:pimeloyl-ACP methyl ester carboxylesterase